MTKIAELLERDFSRPIEEIIKVNNLDEDTFATPAILDGRIYVRTRVALYCFAKPVT